MLRCLEKLAQTKTVSGSPPDINSIFSNLYVGYNPNTTKQIIDLCNYLNTLIFYSSFGKYNFLQIYNNTASIGTTSIVNQDLKKIIEFTKLVIRYLFNNKLPFKQILSNEEIKNNVAMLESNPNLITLSNINVSGQLATKIQGNPKNIILGLLQKIKNLI